MQKTDIWTALQETQAFLEPALEACLPRAEDLPTALPAAMRHALRGGKRLRPFLVLQSARAFGLHPNDVLPTACAVEFMHCATLVHDDMPCIDNAARRHGQPALHVAFNEATALLAADALIILSFECLARQALIPGICATRVLQCVQEFAAATGPRGLIIGEALDIEAEHRPYTEQELEFIHLHKTAKLIIFSTRAGALLAGADAEPLATLTEYARALGLLFQITDDLLDVTATEEELGKPVGADAAAGKATYPGLLGVAAARQRAQEMARQAREAAQQLPQTALWEALVDFVLKRSH